MILDDRGALADIDRHDSGRLLAEFPVQCRRARALRAAPAPVVRRPRVVVMAGMGGSAAAGDVVAACAAETLDVPVLVHRGYGLPAAAAGDALLIATSYSGETVEVLSAVEAARARRVPVVALTSGGALGAWAAAAGLPRVVLPDGLMPRMALGYLLFPALAVLAACGVPVVTERELDEALEVVAAQARDLVPDTVTDKNEAKRLALALAGRLPAVYGGPLTSAAAYRWKTDLEENAKVLAVAGAVPEMNHNEIEIWGVRGARGLHAVLLREDGEPPEIARRFALLRELLVPAAGGVSEAWARGRGRLARLLSLVQLGQWVSYYRAMLDAIDPWPVPMLSEMKRRLDASPDRPGPPP
ncbi:MAG TPA: SIS domain-containing protein [Methylomirabilota bacterium]|nr:SIS domain-containing protein [Methylomirabilota bacterium]